MTPALLFAQETVTLMGVVVDSTSGDPIGAAFLSLDGGEARAIADSVGAFRIAGVDPGEHTVQVDRFGYVSRTFRIVVSSPPEPVELALLADPVALRGLTVTGGASVAVTGRVLDASTGEPLPWASLWLSLDAVELASRGSGDESGVFRMADVPTGSYFLRVERLGYIGQYRMVDVAAPPDPLEIRLQPDTALQRGIAQYNRTLRTRRNMTPWIVRRYGEERLRFSGANGMRQFMEQHAFMNFISCGGGELACVGLRGETSRVGVVIDELVAYGGMDQLDSYQPQELYSVEVVNCRGSIKIHAFTYEYMEQMGRRHRQPFPYCFPEED